ncbi:MAG: WYL domain-containing protein [Lentisphaerae bacterium]|nr:WYL domain-containing protein [Lentisphaerota bacterium]
MDGRRVQRLVRLVAEIKAGRCPNAVSFAAQLHADAWQPHQPFGVSAKTIQRDLSYLRTVLGAPLEYDAVGKGYRLRDSGWALPLLSLEADELFAALFSSRVSEPFLPGPIQQSLGDVRNAELAAGEPGDLNPQILESVVVATGGTVPLAETIARQVLEAWKSARRLRIAYHRAAEPVPIEREVDIHALFLSEGAWYARAYCHLRDQVRSFALHRIGRAELLEQVFERSTRIVAEVARGRVFDYDMVRGVRVHCTADRAAYFRERQWFDGQHLEERPDGSLEARYPEIPAPLLEPWVLSFAGAVTLLSPAARREQLHRLGLRLAETHRGAALSAD